MAWLRITPEPEHADQLPQGGSRATGTDQSELGQRVSNGAPAAAAPGPSRDRPATRGTVGRVEKPTAQPAWPDWAQAVDQRDDPGPPLWQRWLVPALVLIVLGQSAVIAWMWRNAAGSPSTGVVTESVAVTSDPPGAAVVINGVERGRTPVTVEDLPPDGKWAVHLNPDPTPSAGPAGVTAGTLAITTDPVGLEVTVDGLPRGVSPLTVAGLVPGAHEVIVARGRSVFRRTVTVEPGVQTALLMTTAGAGISSGWLTIDAPVPVEVREGGVLLGRSDTPRLLLPVGRHELEFESGEFQYRQRRTVQISAGQAAAVTLDPANGSLSVNALPWGEVLVNGRIVGETPLGNLALPIGTHELTVRHPQLGEQRRTVTIGAEVPTRIGVDLRR